MDVGQDASFGLASGSMKASGSIVGVRHAVPLLPTADYFHDNLRIRSNAH